LITFRAASFFLLSLPLFAADFQNGQAARAVFGQSSFTSHDTGIQISSLVVTQNRLFAADTSRHILTFDVNLLGNLRDDRGQHSTGGCSLCFPAPVSQTNESVMPGVASVSVWGKTVAVADAANHRVLIWRDSSAPRPDRGPDVILGRLSESSSLGASTLVDPVSVALDGKRVFVGDVALHRILFWNSLPLTDDQPADGVLGQSDFVSSRAVDAPGPDTVATPVAMTSDGFNLFVADSTARRVLMFSPGDMPLAPNALVNSASLNGGALAPGTLVTLHANNLTETLQAQAPDTGEPLPRRLGGVEIILDGQPLPLLMVSPTELQAQLPYDIAGRTGASLYLRLEHSSNVLVTPAIAVKLTAASPGVFAFGDREPRAALALHVAQPDQTSGGTPVTDDSPAAPGEVITLWAAGLGTVLESGTTVAGKPHEGPPALVANPVSAQINGQAAQVVSASLPGGSVGVYWIKVVVPPDVVPGSTAYLSISQNGLTSNAVKLAVGPAPR